MFLKLVDTVDVEEISDEFENWPDRIINLRVTSPRLLKLCHQRNLFSFARIFLKLADKVTTDNISVGYEDWIDWIINLRVTPPWLLKKPLFDFVKHNSFSFDRIFIILADRDEISDDFETWPDRTSFVIELRQLNCWKKSLCLTLSSAELVQFSSDLYETSR